MKRVNNVAQSWLNFSSFRGPLARITLASWLVAVPLFGEEKLYVAETKAWANTLLDQMLLPPPQDKWRSREHEPNHDYQRDQLLALGEIGWNETFKRFEEGSFTIAIREILGGSPNQTTADGTERLLAMLKIKTFSGRQWVPQLIAMREETQVNELLHSYLQDDDPQVLEACLLHLSYLNPRPIDIEEAIRLLGHDETNVCFRAAEFLQRSTGHLCFVDGVHVKSQEEWQKWWGSHKTEKIFDILKTELHTCANLLTHSDSQVREDSGIILVAHSGQIFYGFHGEKGWWGVHRGEESKKSWLEWLKLRYQPRGNLETIQWEYDYNRLHPLIPIAAMRATISMNIKDLDSPSSSVRSMARGSIIGICGEQGPFRAENSSREGDWLNEGMTSWWKQRLAAGK